MASQFSLNDDGSRRVDPRFLDARTTPGGANQGVVEQPDKENIPPVVREAQTPVGSQNQNTPAKYIKDGKRKVFKLSRLAKTYGVQNIRLKKGKRDGHTGLTPPPDRPPKNNTELVMRYSKELTQKEWFNGWSTVDLMSLDAFNAYPDSDRPCYPDPGSGALHPLVDRSRWRTRADLGDNECFMPIGNGVEGYYAAENEATWSAMLPGLQMASNILTAAEDSQWWNAFLDPHQYTVEDTTFDKWKTTFHSKPGPVSAADRLLIKQRLVALARYIKLEVGSSDSMPAHSKMLLEKNRKEGADWSVLGCTSPFVRRGPVEQGQPEKLALITLNYKWVYHIMKGYLNAAEREATQFFFAQTLVHELAHAVWLALKFAGAHPDQHPLGHEPYHGDEIVKETGWSMANSFLGVLRNHHIAPPNLGLHTRHWPTVFDTEICYIKPEARLEMEKGTLVIPPNGLSCLYPIPGSFHYQLLSQKFWSKRGCVGGKPFKAPAILGRRNFFGGIGVQDSYDATVGPAMRLFGNELVPEDDFFLGRYGLATNEFQELQARFVAGLSERMTSDRERESLAKGLLQWSDITLDDFAHKREDLRLDEPGEDEDFMWEQLQPMPRPPGFLYIYDVVRLAKRWCCFETMTAHRPAYIVLGYINRTLKEINRKLGQERYREIQQDDWLDFLEYVSGAKTLFKYREYKSGRLQHGFVRGSGVETIAYNPMGWEKGVSWVPPPPPEPILDAENVKALEDFEVFMLVLSGFKSRDDQLRLLRQALDFDFFYPDESEDYDSATFNRRYNIFVDLENARTKKNQRHKWKGPPAHLSLETMQWAFASGRIAGWVSGPFNTLRYVRAECLYTYSRQEKNIIWAVPEMTKELEQVQGDAITFRENQERIAKQMKENEFFQNTLEPLLEDMAERAIEKASAEDKAKAEQIRKAWWESRKDNQQVAKRGEEFSQQVDQDAAVRALQLTTEMMQKHQQKLAEEEAERRGTREELMNKLNEFMHTHWYPFRGSSSDNVPIYMAVFDLELLFRGALGNTVNDMSEAQIRTLSWELQDHIVYLQDALDIVVYMHQMFGLGGWGAKLPDYLTLPSKRREELTGLAMQRKEELEKMPQWHCSDAARDKLNAIIKWRADNPVEVRMLGETECRKWEREQEEKRRRMMRERVFESEAPTGVFNPPEVEKERPKDADGDVEMKTGSKDLPFTMSASERRDVPFTMQRPGDIYGGARGRKGHRQTVRGRDGRSKSPRR